MATDIRPTTPDGAPIDVRVRHPLERLRSIIRRYVLLEGLALVGLFLVLWFWVGLALDYGVFRATGLDWVQEVPWAARAAVLGLVVAALLTLVTFRVLTRLFRDFSHRSLALVLERRFPRALGDRLITAVELADLDRAEQLGYSREMIRKTVEDAKARVDRIPLGDVFNWRRLAGKGLLLGAVLFGGLGVVLVGGVLYSALAAKPLAGFARQSRDVAVIWVERNLLLHNTPWPRDTYLEFLDFPGEERRIGRDGASPRIRVAAWKWVIADEGTPDGWRPLVYADLTPGLLGEGRSRPELPVDVLRTARHQLPVGSVGLGAAGNFLLPAIALQVTPEDLGLQLPDDLPATPQELENWRVDRIEQVLRDDPNVRGYLARNVSPDLILAVEEMFAVLAERAADPANSRRLRLLSIPDEVLLEYWGARTSNEMTLKVSGREYAGVLTELPESVKVRARARDYATRAKRITLVPPPQLEELVRDEYHPAYLYHRPPIDAGLAGLRGLRQEVKDLAVSLTGESSLFEFPAGAELVLRGRADKDLAAAALRPRPGRFPGVPAGGSEEPIPLPLAEDRRSFAFAFAGARKILLPAEFEIELEDTDGVRSRRMIQIRPEEDLPPEVDVAVTVIRKVGANYMCTPVALIPFAEESRVTDKHGLNRVEYHFTYRRLESAGVVNTKATLAAGLWLHTPTVPGLPGLLTAPGYLGEFGRLIASDASVGTGTEPVKTFAELWRQRGDRDVVLAALKQALSRPPAAGAAGPVIRQFDFKANTGFDLQKVLPDLAASPNEQQPRYLINLTVRATDTNVEAPPAMGRGMLPHAAAAGAWAGLEWTDGQTAVNKEPFTFLVVSEADLLAEISKEEEKLILRLEDVVARLTDAEQKFHRTADVLPTLDETDVQRMLAESTRAAEINETLEKTFDMTRDLLKDYNRILEEYRYNRCNPNLITKVEEQVVAPLGVAVADLFPPARESVGEFNAAFAETPPRKPDPGVAEEGRQRLRALVAQLQRVRDGIGEVTTIKKLIDLIRVIDKGQSEIGAMIKGWRDDLIKREFEPKIVSVPSPTLGAGQTAKVRLELDFGLQFAGVLTLKFEAPGGSELKLPGPIEIDSKDADLGPVPVEFAVTAGSKKGEFPVRVVPSPEGRPVTMTVTVK